MSTIRESETNDCTVRAISDAYGVPYETAHAICARHGRQNGMGFYIQSQVLPKLGLTLIESAINQRVSVMLRKLDETKVYMCLIDGHIFTIRRSQIPVEAKENFPAWLKQFGAKKVIRLFEVPQDTFKIPSRDYFTKEKV